MSVFPINRVQDILRRMDDNSAQSEAMKTCFGILAIMSREESNKLIIARDGMESVLNAMTVHVDKTDVQESGCDLLWSLAFNNTAVKDIIAKHGGASVLVRAIKRHSKSPDFLKSACGALSNMCQSKVNQEGVATQGGLQPLVGSIHAHQNNSKLLPFVFDALASLIVSNEDNARTVSSLGLIPLVVASLGRHKLIMEVVKSGCHTLAILSDVKGQASKIAFAGGVPIILSLLDVHASYADLHRVAAVVILRMVQESAHVGREITANEGVRVLLKSLEKGGAQQDTVAAVTHILFTVTNPSSPASSSVEPQLWIYPKTEYEMKKPDLLNSSKLDRRTSTNVTDSQPQTALGGLLTMLETYVERRDVVRASCRLLNNIGGFAGVIAALDRIYVLDKMLDCVSIHSDTKDVIESTCTILKSIHKLHAPKLLAVKGGVINGLLILLRSKIVDEDTLTACADTFVNLLQASARGERKKEHDDVKTAEGQEWEMEALALSLQALGKISGKDDDSEKIWKSSGEGVPISKAVASPITSGRKVIWSKATPKTINSILGLIEAILPKYDKMETLHSKIYRIIDMVAVNLPLKTLDLSKRLDKILSSLCVSLHAGEIETAQKQKEEEGETHQIEEVNRKKEITSNKKTANPTNDQKSTQNIDDKTTAINFSTQPVYWVEGDDGPGGVKRLLPRHPLKNSGSSKDTSCRLLETWPNYLERLNPSSNSINRSFLSTGMGSTLSTERMHICFEGGSAGGKGVPSRCATPVPYNVPFEGVGDPFEHSLTFDSEFESGNLMRAVQRGDANYDLFLRADLHTAGHTQWFYFAVSNTHPSALVRLAEQGVQVPPVRVRFNIVNLTKPDSLFNLGMRPVVYSCHDAATRGISWVRSGTDISYFSNSYQRNNTAGEGVNCYYTLSFTIEFHNAKDTVLIAYSYPYTCDDYKVHIGQIMSKPGASDVIRKSVLCKTLAGEDCDLLIITDFKCKEKDRIGMTSFNGIDLKEESSSFSSSGKKKSSDKASSKLKPALFLSGRVHPGETPASWMMKGILDFLTNNSSQAQLLRKVFVIYIVPILNPDGVIFGNNRCSLAGVDLNRQWKTPMKAMHPTIYHLKTFMMAQKKQREICMYIDLHGHSRKYNVFMYGCDDKKKPRPQVRAFPRFFSMHDIGQKYVCFSDCSFHVKKGRESTARVVVSKEMNIPCSFTLEATFCGSNYGPLKHCHMNIGHLQEVGAALCDAILNFAISEGQVKETMTVPNNLKAVTKIEEAIAAEDGVVFVSKNRENFYSDATNNIKENEERAKSQSNVEEKDIDSDSDFGGSDIEGPDKNKNTNFTDAFHMIKADSSKTSTKNELLLETEKRRLEIKRLGNTMPVLSSGRNNLVGALLLNNGANNNNQVILPMPPSGGNIVPKTTAGVLALRTLNASPVLGNGRKAQDDSSFQLINFGKSASKNSDGIAGADLTRRSAPDSLVLKKNMTKIRRGAFQKKDDLEPINNNNDFEIMQESPRDLTAGSVLSGRKGSGQSNRSSSEKNPAGSLPALVNDK